MPVWCQAIIWINHGLLLSGPWGQISEKLKSKYNNLTRAPPFSFKEALKPPSFGLETDFIEISPEGFNRQLANRI